MKRKIVIGCMIAALSALSVTGCKTKKENDNNTKIENTENTENKGNTEKTENPGNPEDIENTEQAIRIEPSLTKEAKKMVQFKDVRKGDLIAEIKVKDYGTMKLKLFPKQAPKAVENFVTHAKDGYYDGLTFHRILNDFMIQGGDPTGAGGESIWGDPFEDEFSDDLYPYRGALCMANAGTNTNGSQFFIVQADEEEMNTLQNLVSERYNLNLIDYCKQGYDVTLTEKEMKNYLTYGGTPWLTRHHTVFGQLLEGFDVLDAIAETEMKDAESGIPLEAVVIDSITITEYQD